MLDLSRQVWLAGLRKFTGFRGHTQFSLGEDVLPTIDIPSLLPPFHQYSGGLAGVGQNGVAAQFTFGGLQLPVGVPDNFVAVVDLIEAYAQAAAAALPYYVGVVPVALGVAFALNPSTGTWDSGGAPALRSFSGNQVAAVLTGNNAKFTQLGGQNGPPTLIPGPFVIRPGFQLIIQSAAVGAAQQLTAGFSWREFADIG